MSSSLVLPPPPIQFSGPGLSFLRNEAPSPPINNNSGVYMEPYTNNNLFGMTNGSGNIYTYIKSTGKYRGANGIEYTAEEIKNFPMQLPPPPPRLNSGGGGKMNQKTKKNKKITKRKLKSKKSKKSKK